MRVEVLSSGSKGNTTYIETKNAKILIDLGNTCKYVKEKLAKIEVDPSEIDAILITHTHVDHINGLKVFEKRYNTKVFMAPKMQPDLAFIENYEIIEDSNVIVFIEETVDKNSVYESQDKPKLPDEFLPDKHILSKPESLPLHQFFEFYLR